MITYITHIYNKMIYNISILLFKKEKVTFIIIIFLYMLNLNLTMKIMGLVSWV